MEEKFWPDDKYGEELGKEITNIKRFLYHWAVLLQIFFSVCGVVILNKPLWSETRTTPFIVYALMDYSNTTYYLIIYFFIALNIYFGCILVVAYDGLFVDLVSRIVCQVKLLRQGFEDLDLGRKMTEEEEEECLEKAKKLIDHHNLLLRCEYYIFFIVSREKMMWPVLELCKSMHGQKYIKQMVGNFN